MTNRQDYKNPKFCDVCPVNLSCLSCKGDEQVNKGVKFKITENHPLYGIKPQMEICLITYLFSMGKEFRRLVDLEPKSLGSLYI